MERGLGCAQEHTLTSSCRGLSVLIDHLVSDFYFYVNEALNWRLRPVLPSAHTGVGGGQGIVMNLKPLETQILRP